ncbi:hypothetical protein [Microcoleus sp. EPA2]|uniref:hypothetical protein n=1 Tax=Microcoleus sp. EPA2 TaxID=2841654 RepID=UPI00312B7C8E
MRILSAVSPIAISKDAAFRRRICPVNLHQKFTGFTHSDKETGFLPASTHHNQEFSKKPGFWPPALRQRNRVFARIYASQPRILEKTRFLAPMRQPQRNQVFGRIYASQRSIVEKTRFLAPMRQPQRNQVFGHIYASQRSIVEKTRFLATRASAESGFRSIKGVPKNQELISPLSEDFRYETGVFNPWRTIGLTHNLSHSKVFAFTHNTAGESIPRLIAKVG